MGLNCLSQSVPKYHVTPSNSQYSEFTFAYSTLDLDTSPHFVRVTGQWQNVSPGGFLTRPDLDVVVSDRFFSKRVEFGFR